MLTLLSRDCPTKYFPFGWRAVAGIECIDGSEICFTTTGKPNSHMNIFLSSEVETNFLLLSINVSVLIAPRCSSYDCVFCPELMSNCKI